MGFERNYQIINPTKQIHRNYSNYILTESADFINLKPWFITGLIDAEGSFMIRIRKNSKYRTG